jgi:hypothetical protein
MPRDSLICTKESWSEMGRWLSCYRTSETSSQLSQEQVISWDSQANRCAILANALASTTIPSFPGPGIYSSLSSSSVSWNAYSKEEKLSLSIASEEGTVPEAKQGKTAPEGTEAIAYTAVDRSVAPGTKLLLSASSSGQWK